MNDAAPFSVPLRKRPRNDPETQHAKRHNIGLQEALEKALSATLHLVATRPKQDTRLFQEIHYMGSTRAVVGPAYVVRELLFAHEFISLRVPALSAAARDEIARNVSSRGGFPALMDATRELVEVVEVNDQLTQDLGACFTAPCASTIHLKTKHALPPFSDVLSAFGISLRAVSIEKLSAAPRCPPQRPPVVVATPINGNISVTWAAAWATGAARLVFPSAELANAFLHRYIDGDLDIPCETSVRLLGHALSASTEGAAKKKMEVPPIKSLSLANGKTVHVYDVEAINKVSAEEVGLLQYIAEISGGLSPDLNEEELLGRFSLGIGVAAFIKRDGVKHTKIPRDRTLERVKRVLRSCRLAHGDSSQITTHPFEWYDKKAHQSSLRVQFTDLEHIVLVHEAVVASSDLPTPFDQKCQVRLTYTAQLALATDLRRCFADHIFRVFQAARNDGVACSEAAIMRCNTHTTILLRSMSLDALKAAIEAIEETFEGEFFEDRIITTVTRTDTGRQWLKEFIDTEASHRERVCVRIDTVQGSMWVFGGVWARRPFWMSIQDACVQYYQQTIRHGIDYDVGTRLTRQCDACAEYGDFEDEVIQLSACQHWICLFCLEKHIDAAANPLCLLCPAENCARAINVGDVHKILRDNGDLVVRAVLAYLEEHPDEYSMCPQLGCGQILLRSNVDVDRTSSTIKFPACETCEKTHCLSCSDDSSEATALLEMEARRHAEFIQERILKQICPNCQSAFMQSERSSTGKSLMAAKCGHATCSSPWFCKYCFTFSGSSVEEVFRHVSECVENTQPGSGGQVSKPVEEMRRIINELHQRKLHQYLDTQIESNELRRIVSELVAVSTDDAEQGVDCATPVPFPPLVPSSHHASRPHL